jgi:SAM-dependent methyltransferase
MTTSRRYDEFVHDHPRLYYWRGIVKNRIKEAVSSFVSPQWQAVLARNDRVLDEVMRAHCAGKQVLDVGCGPATQLLWMRRSYGADACGIDYSLPMVQTAARECAGDGTPLVCGDATRLPFADGSFDTVTFFWVFHHLPAALHERALAEARRVARDAVIIRDSFNFGGPVSHFLGNLYWRVVDGGYLYRTRQEWLALIGDAKVVEEYGAALNRNCIFVVRASGARASSTHTNA